MLVSSLDFKPTGGISRQTVESASIHSVGFDTESSTLEVEWPKGKVYQYRGPKMQEHFFAMIEAGKRDEAGELTSQWRDADSYFNHNVRGALGVTYCKLP